MRNDRSETSRKKVEEEKARMIATQPQYKSGMLLRVSNLPKGTGFREMREFFARVCDVAWIEIADDQVTLLQYCAVLYCTTRLSLGLCSLLDAMPCHFKVELAPLQYSLFRLIAHLPVPMSMPMPNVCRLSSSIESAHW